jgi:hypothetical protein
MIDRGDQNLVDQDLVDQDLVDQDLLDQDLLDQDLVGSTGLVVGSLTGTGVTGSDTGTLLM